VTEDIPFERHHRASGGADVGEVGPYDVLPKDWKDLRPVKGNPLSNVDAARVLVPLCKSNLARFHPEWAEPSKHGGPERGITGLVWSCLEAAQIKVFVCFVRGHQGEEEIVVVTPDGSASWPIRQLTPEAVDFLEVQAL
jgi:hypothetical protein